MGLGAREHTEEQQDAGERKDEDYEQLQAAAMQRVNSKKVVVPTASRKHIQEVDVRKLTKEQRNRILDQGLQVQTSRVWHTVSAPACYFSHQTSLHAPSATCTCCLCTIAHWCTHQAVTSDICNRMDCAAEQG